MAEIGELTDFNAIQAIAAISRTDPGGWLQASHLINDRAVLKQYAEDLVTEAIFGDPITDIVDPNEVLGRDAEGNLASVPLRYEVQLSVPGTLAAHLKSELVPSPVNGPVTDLLPTLKEPARGPVRGSVYKFDGSLVGTVEVPNGQRSGPTVAVDFDIETGEGLELVVDQIGTACPQPEIVQIVDSTEVIDGTPAVIDITRTVPTLAQDGDTIIMLCRLNRVDTDPATVIPEIGSWKHLGVASYYDPVIDSTSDMHVLQQSYNEAIDPGTPWVFHATGGAGYYATRFIVVRGSTDETTEESPIPETGVAIVGQANYTGHHVGPSIDPEVGGLLLHCAYSTANVVTWDPLDGNNMTVMAPTTSSAHSNHWYTAYETRPRGKTGSRSVDTLDGGGLEITGWCSEAMLLIREHPSNLLAGEGLTVTVVIQRES